MDEYVIGIDLGGTKILTARFDLRGQVLAQVREQTRAEEGPDAVINRMAGTVQAVMQGVDPAGLVGVGVGSPGPIYPATGVVSRPPNLPGWDNVPLRDILRDRLRAQLGRTVPVETGNDANVAALGEFRFGVGRQFPAVRHLVYFTVSTGIGGGVIAGGRIADGAHGIAAEVGHMTVDLNGPLCNCGNIGCIEAIAAGPAIARRGADLVATGRAPLLTRLANSEPEAVTTAMVDEAARQGDPDALALLEYTGRAFGFAVVNIVHLFNPQIVAIGGGVAKMGDLLFDPVRAVVQAHAQPAFQQDLRIVPAALGDLAGVLGAAALVLQDYPTAPPGVE
ncbi:MAG TPA: ROK family protein [Chloroflexia bacterium]|jgi:glucokinase|nr:ROK family protein [Chloroflexia bacterium]